MKTQYILASILIAACLFGGTANVSAATDAASKIKSVQVYPTGAFVTRTAKVNLKAGKNEVKIASLTPQLDQNTLQVGIKGGSATLNGVKYDVEVANRKQITGEVTTLTKRAKFLRDSIDILSAKKQVLENEHDLLLNNRKVGGEQGLSAATLQGVSSFMRKDLNEIVTLQYNYNKRIDALQDELTMIEQKVNLLYEKQIEPTSFLLVSIDAPTATNSEIELQYFVKNASWMPFYEARINRNDNNLHLVQKAYVSQASKENWNKVALSLSQNDPTISNEKPSLGRYSLPNGGYAEFHSDSPVRKEEFVKILGVVRDKETPLKGVLVTCGDDRKTETDDNGYYELLVPVGKDVTFMYKNYGTTSSRANGTNVVVRNVIMDSYRSKVSEVASKSIYSNYIAQNRIYFESNVFEFNDVIDDKKPQIAVRNYAQDIVGLNSVPQDGADHEMVVKDITINADYHYYAIPKLSKDVYLVANVTDWKKLDLIDGSVKLYLNNMYMGETFINARQTEDTLKLSIGKDRDIAVERTDIRNYTSKNAIKTSNKVQRDWKITVKNNKKESAKVTVEDQFPVSNDSDIKVELLESSGAKVDDIDGKLIWELSLKPGEKKELKFSYSVKSKAPISVE